MDLTALLFVRFMFALGWVLQGLLLFMQLDLLKPFGYAGLIFAVEQGRFLSRAALLIEIGNPNFPTVLILTDNNKIAYFDFLARLAALTVNMHFAAVNRFRSQTAGFEKTCRPQPFINADFV
jgi:hypothetical protein